MQLQLQFAAPRPSPNLDETPYVDTITVHIIKVTVLQSQLLYLAPTLVMEVVTWVKCSAVVMRRHYINVSMLAQLLDITTVHLGTMQQ